MLSVFQLLVRKYNKKIHVKIKVYGYSSYVSRRLNVCTEGFHVGTPFSFSFSLSLFLSRATSLVNRRLEIFFSPPSLFILLAVSRRIRGVHLLHGHGLTSLGVPVPPIGPRRGASRQSFVLGKVVVGASNLYSGPSSIYSSRTTCKSCLDWSILHLSNTHQ